MDRNRHDVVKAKITCLMNGRTHCAGVIFTGTLLLLGFFVIVWPTASLSKSWEKSLSFEDNFDSGNLRSWQMPYPEDWEVLTRDGTNYFHMIRPKPPGVPRCPLQFAC
jgi:hypothetical protein